MSSQLLYFHSNENYNRPLIKNEISDFPWKTKKKTFCPWTHEPYELFRFYSLQIRLIRIERTNMQFSYLSIC